MEAQHNHGFDWRETAEHWPLNRQCTAIQPKMHLVHPRELNVVVDWQFHRVEPWKSAGENAMLRATTIEEGELRPQEQPARLGAHRQPWQIVEELSRLLR